MFTPLNITLYLAGILLGAIGAILLKIGSSSVRSIEPTISSVWQHVVLNPWLMGGIMCYLLPTAIWIYLLSRVPLSQLQPMLALTYVVTPLLALLVLSEHIPLTRWIGIGVIIAGIVIVTIE
ncbi:MAG TPA: EamA family transporter [bacterium]|nr:EamA family transporter [bacterium]